MYKYSIAPSASCNTYKKPEAETKKIFVELHTSFWTYVQATSEDDKSGNTENCFDIQKGAQIGFANYF